MLLPSWVQRQTCHEVLLAGQELQWAKGSQQSEECVYEKAACPAAWFWNTSSLKLPAAGLNDVSKVSVSPGPSGFPFWSVWDSLGLDSIHRLLPSGREPSLCGTQEACDHDAQCPLWQKMTSHDLKDKCTPSREQTKLCMIIHPQWASRTG